MFSRSPLLRCKKLLLFLLIGMCCRSVVATGFMLDTNPADGSLVSVIICPGQPNLDVFSNFEPVSGHEHHAHHHEPEKHEHSAHGDRTSTCGLWTASGLSIISDEVPSPIGLLNTIQVSSAFQSPLYTYSFPRSGSAREPPRLS